jgi:O-antigen/teichoic acid export membrane protein
MTPKFLQNLAGAFVNIVIGLVVIPPYIRTIGTERYGVLALAWLILGYLGVLDLGMSRSSTNALARVDDSNLPLRGRIFATALLINTVLGAIGGAVITLLGGEILLSAHALSTQVRGELQAIVFWIAPILPLTLASGISIGALDAREKFLTSNVLQVTSNSLGLIVPLLVATFISPRLTAVIPALFFTRLVCTIIMLGFNVVDLGTLRVLRFDRISARKLLHFGGWVTVTNLVGPVMASFDQFLIGGVLGAKSVTFYSIPINAGSRLQLFSNTLARTLFPLFSRTEKPESLSVAQDALISLSFLSVLVFAPIIPILSPLLSWWLGNSLAASVMQVAPILLVGTWFNGLAIIPYSLIQGQGRPDLVAKIHLIELLPYVCLLLVAIHWFGIVGVALTWSIRSTIDLALLWRVSGIPIRFISRLCSSVVLLGVAIFAGIIAAHFGLIWRFGFSIIICSAGFILWTLQDPRGASLISMLETKLKFERQ